ncbi:MAG: peroxidase [bacterium]|nr:peroxidase [bacterium]
MRSLGSTEGIPVDDDLKTQLATNYNTADLSHLNKLILAYAEKITREAHSIDQAYVNFLKSNNLSDQMIHDIAQIAAYYAYVNRIADALGVELESE